MKPFKVHLRSKEIGNGQLSLYLDFGRPVFHPSKNKFTRRDFLGLYIFAKPKNKLQREHNRNINELAEKKQAEVLLAINNGTYGAIDSEAEKEKKRGEMSFYEFFESRMNQRKGRTKISFQSTLYHLKNFAGEELKVKNVTAQFLLDFRDYLDTQAKVQHKDKLLSQNSKYLYFGKLRTVLREGYKRKIFLSDLRDEIDAFKVEKASRPFFLDADVRKLRATDFPKSPELKKAALFSILTSLRFSDVYPLRFEQIQYDPAVGHFIDFKSQKINRPDILYLTEEVLQICEYEEYKQGRIFLLRYWESRLLPEWFNLAGVKIPPGIKFHVFRHTFAIRALNKGESLERIKSMMGHASIKTTEVYAKMLDKNKRDAMHRITLD